MRDPWAYTYNNNYVNYQVAPFGGVSYQITMYNGNDILSTVYPIDSNTMEFFVLSVQQAALAIRAAG